MAYATSTTTLKSSRADIEFLFHKILSPIRKTADPNLIFQFCQKLNDIDETQHAADLIISKILSTQDWEVIIALNILEACVKNCGEPMHEIIGRFRFLNEMIKLISPKYFGNRTSEPTKKKCIELIYSWSRDLPYKVKIKEAYSMIKKQGIVCEDPEYVEELEINVAPREKKSATFEDEENSRRLARLLKSKNPGDLEMANKLIKNMVKQEEIKVEKNSERINELERINNNIKLLTEMLTEYDSKNARSSEKETIKYLYEELKKMQPNLIKLATETDDNDESIGDILKTNDACDNVIKKYQSNFDHQFAPDDALVNLNSITDDFVSSEVNNKTNNNEKTNSTKDLQDLFSNTSNILNGNVLFQSLNSQQIQKSTPNIFDDLIPVEQNFTTPNIPNNNNNMFMMNTSTSLNSINNSTNNNPFQPLQPTITARNDSNNGLNQFNTSQRSDFCNPLPTSEFNSSQGKLNNNKPAEPSKPFDDLNELSKALMGNSLNFTPTSELQNIKSQKMNDMIKASNNLSQQGQQLQPKQNDENVAASVFESLNSIFVELETIKPATTTQPLNLYDKNNLKIVLHFARDSPSKFTNIIVISTTNMNTQSELKNFLFQAAVTKNMRVKLQPASRSDLPAYNPILPLMPITQIMLIANPHQEQVRLRYKLSYTYNSQQYVENDEVKNFPKLVDGLN